jgi:hypothetical protein
MKKFFLKIISFFVSFFQKQKENKQLRQVNRNLNSLSRENEEFFGGEASVSAQIQSPEITS